MKKIISILLAVMLVVSVAVVSAGAYNSDGDYTNMTSGSVYKPKDSYTVDDNTPTCEQAILACGGSLDRDKVQYLYFQLPKEDANQKGSDWANKFNTDKNGVCQVCLYWWGGIGSDWTDFGGGPVKWTGYRTTLIDEENRIYRAVLPLGTPTIVWDNGVNGGMDSSKEIFNYARQIADKNVEGGEPDDYDTLPEGTPDPESMDGCIQIINYDESRMTINSLTGFPAYDADWYVYYGSGCYGEIPMNSKNFHGKYFDCKNPEHHHTPGDASSDGKVNILDVFCIQRYLIKMAMPTGSTFNETNADVDCDDFVSIIDATRIQRFKAGRCNLDGSTPYSDSSPVNPK